MTKRQRQIETPNEIRLEDYLVRRAALDLERAEYQLARALSTAISQGVPWDNIETILGSAAPRARQIRGALLDRAS